MREVAEKDVAEGDLYKRHGKGETSRKVEVVGRAVARGDVAKETL